MMVAVSAAVLSLAISTGAVAQDQRAQPAMPRFVVTAADGTIVEGRDVFPQGRSLLVYLMPALEPAQQFASALREWWSPAFAGRVVLIVLGDPRTAAAFIQERFEGADVRWYADPDGSAWRTLGFQGNLALAGVEERSLDWKLDGVLNNPSALQRVVRTWLEGPQ